MQKMQNTVIFSLFHDKYLNQLTLGENCQKGQLAIHEFPDKEMVIKIKTEISEKHVIFYDSLENPNDKIVALLFAAKTARELGAKKITLFAPYLAYMRQDKQFEAGQGITSKYFAEWISSAFDELITIDPHLHRWKTLQDIYTIPTTHFHAASSIARWSVEHIQNPVFIGPDQESEQWVCEIAGLADAPYIVLKKNRLGDKTVTIDLPDIHRYQSKSPVLVDDIVSSGVTMLKTIELLGHQHPKSPICIAVHGIFSDSCYSQLKQSGAKNIITCDTIPHSSNQIFLIEDILNKISAE